MVENKYYVYRHYIGNNTFYVGKGSGNRAYVKSKRNKKWKEIVENNNGVYEIEILKHFNNKDEALEYEYKLQKQYWDINQCEACLSYNNEWKNKMVETLKGKKHSKEWNNNIKKSINKKEVLNKIKQASQGSNNSMAMVIVMIDNNNKKQVFYTKKDAVDYIHKNKLCKYKPSGIGNKIHEAITENKKWLDCTWIRYNKKEYMEVEKNEQCSLC